MESEGREESGVRLKSGGGMFVVVRGGKECEWWWSENLTRSASRIFGRSLNMKYCRRRFLYFQINLNLQQVIFRQHMQSFRVYCMYFKNELYMYVKRRISVFLKNMYLVVKCRRREAQFY